MPWLHFPSKGVSHISPLSQGDSKTLSHSFRLSATPTGGWYHYDTDAAGLCRCLDADSIAGEYKAFFADGFSTQVEWRAGRYLCAEGIVASDEEDGTIWFDAGATSRRQRYLKGQRYFELEPVFDHHVGRNLQRSSLVNERAR